MTSKEVIFEIVDQTIETFNCGRSPERKIKLGAEGFDTIIFGNGSPLDSLDLVNFIVKVEENLENLLSINIAIAHEKAFSLEKSPFATTSLFVEYIWKLLHDLKYEIQ